MVIYAVWLSTILCAAWRLTPHKSLIPILPHVGFAFFLPSLTLFKTVITKIISYPRLIGHHANNWRTNIVPSVTWTSYDDESASRLGCFTPGLKTFQTSCRWWCKSLSYVTKTCGVVEIEIPVFSGYTDVIGFTSRPFYPRERLVPFAWETGWDPRAGFPFWRSLCQTSQVPARPTRSLVTIPRSAEGFPKMSEDSMKP